MTDRGRPLPARSAHAAQTVTSFSVLIVCTANLCRSPMAEAMFRAAAGDVGVAWEISSAGVRPNPRLEVPWEVRQTLAELGLEVPAATSRQLTPALIDEADLVLTARSGHRAHVVSMRPNALRKAFTLRQFARYVDRAQTVAASPATVGFALLDGARLARSRMQPADPDADEIADPFGGELTDYAACRDQLADAIAPIVRWVVTSLGQEPSH